MSEAKSTSSNSQETEITLGLLSAVEENSAVTQRSVARDLGIALGLANAYLKRCVKKGLVKVNQIPPNRYTYYLTPKGFSEKSRLTAEYLGSSFTFFRRARSQCDAMLAACAEKGWRRIGLWGAGDLAEITALCNGDYGLELTVVIEGAAPGERFVGLPVVGIDAVPGAFDAIAVTDHANAQADYDALVKIMPEERVLLPEMLAVTRGGLDRGESNR